MATNMTEPEAEKNAAAPPETAAMRERVAQRWANPRFRLLTRGAVALVLLLLVTLYFHYRNRESTDDAQVDGHILPVASKIYGNVAEVLVTDNQAVKAGQVLVRIDPRDDQAKLNMAKAALADAESKATGAHADIPMTVTRTESSTSGADAQFAAAEADFESAKATYGQATTSGLAYARANVAKRQADYEKAQADLERMKPLVAKDEISKQQFDGYVAAAQVAQSELKADQEKLSQAEQNVLVQKAALVAAQARVKQAQAGVEQARGMRHQVAISNAGAVSASAAVAKARADLEAAELNLSYTTITAASDGVVTRKSVEVGQIVQPGQSLLILIPLNDVWVTANFKETQLAKVRAGQKAEVHVDMYGKTFTGHVDSIAGATGARLSLLPPENATGNFVKVVERIPVKIVLDPVPPDQAILRPGMNVNATIITR
jgi:membrane fusion protein (multidrug efflux system)